MNRRILLMITAAGALMLLSFAFWRQQTQRPTDVSTAVDAEALHAGWKSEAARILERYDQDRRADAARDALVALRVASDDRDAHLGLVLAFEAFVDGSPNAQTRLEQARQLFNASP